MESQESHLIFDVRSRGQARNSPLNNSTNVPADDILNNNGDGFKTVDETIKNYSSKKPTIVYIICSHGIMAEKVYCFLKKKYSENEVKLYYISSIL